MPEFISHYWIEWVFGLIVAGIGWWAKRYVKLEKESVNRIKAERAKEIREEVLKEVGDKIESIEKKSNENDRIMSEELEVLSSQIENLSTGILSMQGRQFRSTCLFLLATNHEITLSEYEQFEEDYMAYKALGGNHKGDSLHDRVVTKFNAQIKKEVEN